MDDDDDDDPKVKNGSLPSTEGAVSKTKEGADVLSFTAVMLVDDDDPNEKPKEAGDVALPVVLVVDDAPANENPLAVIAPSRLFFGPLREEDDDEDDDV